MARTSTMAVRLACVAGVLIGLIGLIFNLGLAIGLAVVFGALLPLGTEVLFDRGDKTRWNIWRSVRLGLAAAPVVAGLIVIFGEATGPVVLLCLGAGIWWYARRRSSCGGRSADADPANREAIDQLAGLSNSELRRAWRASHARLRSARDGVQLERLCELRRRQLEEMERRDPPGFQRWLASDGWISGSAAPFLDK
jgi:hypothetical protein